MQELCSNQLCVHFLGIVYQYLETLNDLLEVRHHQGEDEMNKGEYKRSLWRPNQLRPAAGGCMFETQMVGTRYKHWMLV